MKPAHKILLALGIVVAIPVGVVVAFMAYAAIWYEGHDEIASFPLSGGHSLRVYNDRQWDIAYSVLCELGGPNLRHEARMIGVVGAGDSPPHFSLHTATNRELFWITADNMPDLLLYAVDFQSGKFWPGLGDSEQESTRGRQLLSLIGPSTNHYHLYKYEWIGVKK